MEMKVRTVTFPTLMARYDIDRVDLAVVDAEGFDDQVVRLALAAGISPRMIASEHLHLTTADRRACADLLTSHGYRLLRDRSDTIALSCTTLPRD